MADNSENVKKGAYEFPAGPATSNKREAVSPAKAVREKKGAVRVNDDRYSSALVAHHERGGHHADRYRTLRTNLLTRYEEESRSICLAITSAETGEGKSVTTLNLALVWAELPDFRIVVVDGDLRRGTIHSLLGVDRSPGFSDVLLGQCKLEEVIRPTVHPNLDVVTSGEVKASQLGEVIGQLQRNIVIPQLRQRYNCVLIDTPPVGLTSDAAILGRSVDEALLIVRMHKTNRSAIERTISLLHAADVRIRGMFLTHQQRSASRYYGRYY